jgi:hypothetical protein
MMENVVLTATAQQHRGKDLPQMDRVMLPIAQHHHRVWNLFQMMDKVILLTAQQHLRGWNLLRPTYKAIQLSAQTHHIIRIFQQPLIGLRSLEVLLMLPHPCQGHN